MTRAALELVWWLGRWDSSRAFFWVLFARSRVWEMLTSRSSTTDCRRVKNLSFPLILRRVVCGQDAGVGMPEHSRFGRGPLIRPCFAALSEPNLICP